MRKNIKLTAAAAATAALALGLTACGTASDPTAKSGSGAKADESRALVVAASPTPHADILNYVKDNLAKKAGLKLEVKEFTDYVLPNTATESGQVDANFFQHKPYLDDFNKKNNTHIVPVVNVHLEPLGLYSKKVKDLKEIKSGQTVAVPNDTTNEGRALKLLADNGLITLKSGVGSGAKLSDIQDKKGLEFKEIEAATLPRALNDVDAAVINGNYAIEADLKPAKDSLRWRRRRATPTPTSSPSRRAMRRTPGCRSSRSSSTPPGEEVHRGHVRRLGRPGLRRRQVTLAASPLNEAPRTPTGAWGLVLLTTRPCASATRCCMLCLYGYGPYDGLRHGAAHDYHLPGRVHQHGAVGAAPLRGSRHPGAHRDDERRAGYRLDLSSAALHGGARRGMGVQDRLAERTEGRGIVLAVTEFLTQRLVGTVHLQNTNWRTLATEVAYVTAPWARGEGYATESVLAVAQWLFKIQKFERIELRTAADNTASQQVAQKIGCISEGVLRNAWIARTQTEDGGWADIRTDLIVWSLLPEDIEGVSGRMADAGYASFTDWN